ncbi:MAG TPA: redoxin domain-containing protein [Planctomycetaceae bacterium]|nr:redoxin domain-containing protein [Planctomycetaceae bacterium]
MTCSGLAQTPETAPAKDAADPAAEVEVLAGHSYHGDFLNEGPRQKAYLMGGTGAVTFPVTSAHPEVRAFIEQGIGQWYGFWYLEAERSFRHAASLDPECAMAYWGAALATQRNSKRSTKFMEQALKRKDKASEREKMYIDSLDKFLKADSAKKDERDAEYRKSLEDIALKYPEDLEAKAFLALQLYLNKKDGYNLAADGLMQQIFQVEPLHPAHHFCIHLWDYKKPENALASSARCGQGSPSIAHMWHMPGHIYSRLKRYEDACWQQEASARVDHAHMIRDRLLPDEIHNFAHNNEWLIRNLNYVGRVHDAVELSKNMIELPRHPKYNSLNNGSSHYGRMRLFETLGQNELWGETVALCRSSYLEPTDALLEQIKRSRHLGIALAMTGESAAAEIELASLREILDAETKKRDAARDAAETKAIDDLLKQEWAKKSKEVSQLEADAPLVADRFELPKTKREELINNHKKEIDKAKQNATRTLDRNVRESEQAIQAIEAYLAIARDDYASALPLLRKAGQIDQFVLALVQHRAGEAKPALEEARKQIGKKKNEVLPQARFVELLWLDNQRDEALKEFEKLRNMSSSIDIDAPVFSRLAPIAQELGLPSDWRIVAAPRDDVGDRPALDSLGPFRWSPYAAPEWKLADAENKEHSLAQFRGKPVVVIFYLGHGCLHCVEQLQAFAPKHKEFQAAGIELIAISSESHDDLKISVDRYGEEPLPFPLVSNHDLDVFKQWRVYDDFEQQPLHGSFLIDPAGRVLWQDISYEPFMDPTFVIAEAKRLLDQQKVPGHLQTAK